MNKIEDNDKRYNEILAVLPNQLDSEQEEKEISNLYTENNMNARLALVEHNLRLVVDIAHRFNYVAIDELISYGTMGLINAINSYADYKSNKSINFKEYISQQIEGKIVNYLEENDKLKNVFYKDTNINYELLIIDVFGVNYHATLKENDINHLIELLDASIKKLSKIDRDIVNLRYEENNMQSHTDVADMLQVSKEFVIRHENKIISSLKKDILKILYNR